MTLSEFINTYNGVGVDVDGFYGDQCMDLAGRYVADVYGLPLFTLAQPYARNVWENFDNIPAKQYFDRIAWVSPQPGDLVIWSALVGTAGHIAIFVSGNAQSFTSLDQNWPTGSKTHLQQHDYRGIYGVLRRKGQMVNNPTQVEAHSVFVTKLFHEPTQTQLDYYSSHPWPVLLGDGLNYDSDLAKRLMTENEALKVKLAQAGKTLDDYDPKELIAAGLRRLP